MRLSKRHNKIVKRAVDNWVSSKTLSTEEGDRLKNSIETIDFDWKRLAKYSFWISIICLVIAVGSVIADEALMALLEEIFNAPALVKCIFFFALSVIFYFLGVKRKNRIPEKVYSNESIFFFGVLSTATAIGFLGQAIDTGSGRFSLLILFAALIYLALGFWFPSKLVWFFGLLSLGGWFGAETGYVSGWGAYYLGMNYPLRFVLFGAVLIFCSYLLRNWPQKKQFFSITRIMGLLYFLIALWIMSIFGNYGSMNSWYDAKQIELFHWSLLFGVFTLLVLLHGIKFDDRVTRGFGLTFLFINLYTRFFEYFWDSLHKAIFFGLLGITFWILGRHAEKLWNIGSNKVVAE